MNIFRRFGQGHAHEYKENSGSSSPRRFSRGSALRLAVLAALVVGGLALHGARPRNADAYDYQYVQELKVVSGWSSSVSCGAGWTKKGTDLNKGAGGRFIYACLKYGATTDFETVYAVWGRSRDVPCRASTDKKIDGANNYNLDGNLNASVGGRYVYFCMRPYQAGSGLNTLGDIEFVVISQSTPEWLAKDSAKQSCSHQYGGDVDLQDLNDGAGGAYIYTCREGVR